MRFAIVGCGYVADMYVRTLQNHPNLELAGVYDQVPERRRRFAEFYELNSYSSIDDVLGDRTIQLVANLTNPRSHYAVSKAALEAGKHVYSEKPLATSFAKAEELVDIAETRGLLLASAPCSVLGEAAQTLWKALRERRIGTPRLAYADLDEAFLFKDYSGWISESGTPWPSRDEFETGCTLEHAGYYLGWLVAFFGPAKRIVSYAGVAVQKDGVVVEEYAPASAVACVEFVSGPIARVTCSSYTESDLRLRIFGDDGILSIEDCWDYGSPVYFDRRVPVSWREKRRRTAQLLGIRPALPLVRPADFKYSRRGGLKMDFSRGIAEIADALMERRTPRLSARWSLHVTELVLAMAAGERVEREVRTRFEPIVPMPWASNSSQHARLTACEDKQESQPQPRLAREGWR